MRILANDGIDAAGRKILEAAGHEVFTDKIEQADLSARISEYDVLIVRSATKVTAEVMDASSLKLIARAGVGMDNIDLKHAGRKNIAVVNTPNASSRSVAELVFAHMFSLSRYLHISNREMPEHGREKFNDLKKLGSKGVELFGKKMGIIGFGRIGQEVGRMAVGLGMELLVYDYKERGVELTVEFNKKYAQHNFAIPLKGHKLEDVLRESDFVTLHVPGGDEFIGEKELSLMKPGACLINCARGGVVNEKALLDALNNGKILGAGIDVFEKEPPEFTDILKPGNVSLSPHVGASTAEAQERVGIELAERICNFFKGR